MRYLLIPISFVIFSCSKEDRNRYDFAGAWNMTSLEQSFYSNNNIDSTATYSDLGVWLLTDNSSSTYNILEYEMISTWPVSFSSFLSSAGLTIQAGSTNWYTDYSAQDRFTVHEDLYTGAAWQIFTVIKVKKNRVEMQYAEADPTNAEFLSYKEIFILERM